MGEEGEDGVGSPGSRIPIWSTKWGKHRGWGALGLVSPSKHRKKEPSQGQNLLDLGAWRLGRARGSC